MTCDCLNDCDDDPWLKDGSGRAQPCDKLLARQEHARVIGERLATITALRANYGADNVFELIELMHAEVVRLDAVQRSLFARCGEIPASNEASGQYATAEETAALVYQETPDERWLDQQLDRLYPGRHEMGSIGDVDALSMLVFELRDKAAKPLTDEQIVKQHMPQTGPVTYQSMIKFARAIESAHGIKDGAA